MSMSMSVSVLLSLASITPSFSAAASSSSGSGCCELAKRSGVYEDLSGLADEECCRLVAPTGPTALTERLNCTMLPTYTCFQNPEGKIKTVSGVGPNPGECCAAPVPNSRRSATIMAWDCLASPWSLRPPRSSAIWWRATCGLWVFPPSPFRMPLISARTPLRWHKGVTTH